LALQVVGLTLSWWGNAAKWWTLRGVSLAATGLWIATLLAHGQPWGAAMWFTVLYAALYQIELVLSAKRGGEAAVEAGAGVSFSVIVTAALTAAVLWMFRSSAPAVRGIF